MFKLAAVTQGAVADVESTKKGKGWIAFAVASAALFLGSCSTTTVTRGSQLQEDQGLVAVRLLDLGDVMIDRLSVQSEASGKIYPLSAMRFGQARTGIFVGLLPAGRYHPHELTGAQRKAVVLWDNVTAPIEGLTGKFDVEAGRATQLGSIAYYPVPGTLSEPTYSPPGTLSRSFRIGLLLDPTPVPVEAMLAARFPELAKAAAGRPPLGWLDGTVPTRLSGDLAQARALVKPVNSPTFLDEVTYLAGGPLGVISEQRADGTSVRYAVDTVNTITAVLPLQDGRWLAGGEEGYLAISTSRGRNWRALPPLPPDEVVMHLTQRPDLQLFVVTDSGREIAVYESSDNPIAWKEIKRIPSVREETLWMKANSRRAVLRLDFAASSNDRLVILSRPGTLNSFDFRSRKWERVDIPRMFHAGIKVTPDGYITGTSMHYWVFGSHDYGKSWKRLEAWIHMTEPHFLDGKRGVMLAGEHTLSGSPYQVRTTSDGGQTWQNGATVERWIAQGLPNFTPERPVRPLWANPTGRVLYTLNWDDRVSISRNGGQTWEDY